MLERNSFLIFLQRYKHTFLKQEEKNKRDNNLKINLLKNVRCIGTKCLSVYVIFFYINKLVPLVSTSSKQLCRIIATFILNLLVIEDDNEKLCLM